MLFCSRLVLNGKGCGVSWCNVIDDGRLCCRLIDICRMVNMKIKLLIFLF